MKTYLLKIISLHEASLAATTDVVDRYLITHELQAAKRQLAAL